jgi:hypothetical protein
MGELGRTKTIPSSVGGKIGKVDGSRLRNKVGESRDDNLLVINWEEKYKCY